MLLLGHGLMIDACEVSVRSITPRRSAERSRTSDRAADKIQDRLCCRFGMPRRVLAVVCAAEANSARPVCLAV